MTPLNVNDNEDENKRNKCPSSHSLQQFLPFASMNSFFSCLSDLTVFFEITSVITLSLRDLNEIRTKEDSWCHLSDDCSLSLSLSHQGWLCVRDAHQNKKRTSWDCLHWWVYRVFESHQGNHFLSCQIKRWEEQQAREERLSGYAWLSNVKEKSGIMMKGNSFPKETTFVISRHQIQGRFASNWTFFSVLSSSHLMKCLISLSHQASSSHLFLDLNCSLHRLMPLIFRDCRDVSLSFRFSCFYFLISKRSDVTVLGSGSYHFEWVTFNC
jgi:hypothetical protein